MELNLFTEVRTGIKKKEKKNIKLNWYKNSEENENKFKTVLFVPVTKGRILAKDMKQREEEINKFSKERIKIVESSGVNIKESIP